MALPYLIFMINLTINLISEIFNTSQMKDRKSIVSQCSKST